MTFDLSKRPDVSIGIDMADYCSTGNATNVPLACIRAVDEVESAGSGFLKSGRPKILFEGHYFYRALAKHGLAAKAHQLQPTICYPKWISRYYIGREGEYGRLAKATELCHQFGVSDALALRSASWGRYQIMGDNFRTAGYSSVELFVDDIFRDEGLHLKSFAEYIVNAFLDDELQNLPSNPLKYAALFAHGYNGAGYRRNKYDIKIANAFRKFNAQSIDCASILAGAGQVVTIMPGERFTDPAESGFENTSLDARYTGRILKRGMHGDDVKELQKRLIHYAFMAPDIIHGSGFGKFGPKTEAGLIGFQKANGLTPDGKLGSNTYRRLFG